MQGDARPGHADGVAHRDRATAAVHFFRVDAEFTGRRQRHRREGFVDLDHVELVGGDSLPGHRLLDRVRGLGLQGGIRARDVAVRTDLTQPGQSELLCPGLVHDHHRARAVGDLRRRTGRDRAILAECRAQAAQRLRGGVGPDAFVLGEIDRVTLALRNLHRHNLIGENTVFPGRCRLLVRSRGELVLLGPGELVGVVALLGERTHRLVGEDVVQAVIGHVVPDRDVAVLVARPAVHQQMRGPRHGLLTTRHYDVELTGADQLVGQGDGIDAGQAHLVDGQRGHVPADAGTHRGLAGGHLSGPRGEHLSHDHVLDQRSRDSRLLQSPADGDGAQVGAREILQRTHQAPDRRTRPGNDHRCSHFCLLLPSISVSHACRGLIFPTG